MRTIDRLTRGPYRGARRPTVKTQTALASTVAFAAMLTISVEYASLVSARFILPLSDRFETRLVARESDAAAD